MSSFFRPAADISSSREDSSVSQDVTDNHTSEDYSIARVRTLGSSATIDQSRGDNSDAFSTGSAPASFHRDVLLHALLEERCVNEAMEELRNAGMNIDTKHHPRVQALAAEKYSGISQTLTSYGVVERGLDSEQLSPLRQQYRDGLSLLSQNSTGGSQTPLSSVMSQMNMSNALQKLVSGPSDGESLERRLSKMAITGPGLAEPRFLGSILPNHPLLDSTRYTRDFDEFGVLGKGGYGTVFHVNHKLDGRPYAVKKIPLGPNRLRRIQEKGQSEMDNILLELRTLARLDHPNVVRYYSGWIEYASLAVHTETRAVPSNGRKLLEGPESSSDDARGDSHAKHNETPIPDIDIQFEDDAGEGAGFRDSPGGRFATQEEQDILFEDSTRHTDTSASTSNSFKLGSQLAASANLEKMRSRSTIASVSEDSEIELITRSNPSSSDPSQSFTDSAPSSSGPSLALHIQMSLYSTTLSSFLSPSSPSPEVSTIHSLRHCFHPSASLRILLSIIDGVEYLHSEGIVHRDLKPGNIFLAIRPGTSRTTPDAIALSSCASCNSAAQPRPFNLQLCIGDFGLVSAIAAPDDLSKPSAPSRAVGTEIYRPEVVVRDNHPSLDLFALGIVAFELVWEFGTRMERHETLHALKKGVFPADFEDVIQCDGFKGWIAGLIGACDDRCPSWAEVRAGVIDMLGTCD